jgi:hypothetical protein
MRKHTDFKILVLLLIAILAFHTLSAQFTQTWVHALGNTTGDVGNAIARDANGNVFITGYFNGTVDFDPGTAVYNLTSGPNNDAYLAKYSAAGSLLWAHAFGSTDTDIGEAITTDGAGNVYLGMSFSNTIDMDPGTGLANFTSPGFSSGILAKYDANGNYLWAFMLASPGSSGVSDIVTDASNNVYFTGSFHGTVDFDPGPSTVNLVSGGNADICFAKYDANGNFILAKNMGAGAFDVGFSIEIDAALSIYISGYYRLTVDFDPGPATANITAVGTLNDIFFAKYDAAGNYLWAKSVGSTSNDVPGGIALDAAGNIFVSGGFAGVTDFDPGPGTVNITPQGRDIFLGKYDANGNYLWVKSIGGSGTDGSYATTSDGTGGCFITGEFTGIVDFDPGTATFNLASNGGTDIFFARFNAAGNFSSAGNVGGANSDLGRDIELAEPNSVIVTGYFQGTADFDPGTGVNNLTSAGIFDIYFGKYSSNSGSLPVTLTSFDAICTATVIQLSWNSKEEKNAARYVIEKSPDGIHFDSIGKIEAKGAGDYRYNDQYVSIQKMFYRLRQVDRDERFIFSKTITAHCRIENEIIRLFPNPATDKLIIELNTSAGEVKHVRLIDVLGRTVKLAGIKNPPGQLTIDIQSLPKGTYLLQVEYRNQVFQKQFMKQ